jgi:hypothetical protein
MELPVIFTVVVYALGSVVAGDELGADREFVGCKSKGLTGNGLGDTVELEKDVAGTHGGNPVLGLTFTFAHSGFGRACGDGLVREDADPELAFALHVAGERDTGGLDLGVGNPGTIQSLETEFTEIDVDIARGVPGAASALGLAVFDSFWQQGHDFSPLENIV